MQRRTILVLGLAVAWLAAPVAHAQTALDEVLAKKAIAIGTQPPMTRRPCSPR